MPDRRALSSARLLWARARARSGLLSSAAATVAAAVATMCLVLAGLRRAVDTAGEPPPPGLTSEQVADLVGIGAAALASATPALVLLVALVAGTAMAQLARLVAAAREHETLAIRARGFSRAQAWGADAAEGVAVALVGAIIGVLVAAALAGQVGAGAVEVVASWPWVIAMAVALAAVFAIALRRGEQRRTAGRAARATTVVVVVVVVLASALVVWQLPLARGAGFDPIVALAPAVVLMAGALVALAVFGAAAAAWSRPAAAFPSLQPGYPARQVARRLPIYAVAVLLVTLTVAQAVFASAYTATWQAMTTDSAAVRAGADLRVDMTPQTASPGDVVAARVPGTDASSSAYTGVIEIGRLEADLVSVPSGQIEPVVTSAGGLVDKEALIAAADATGDGVVVSEPVSLGDGATGIAATVGLTVESGSLSGFSLVALLLDAQGTPATLRLSGEPQPAADGTALLVATAELPDGASPWRLLAIGAGTGPSIAGSSVAVELSEVVVAGGGPLDVAGSAHLEGGSSEAVLWLADGGVLAAAPDLAASEEAPAVAAVVTTALASRLGAVVGDPIDFRYAGTGRQGAAVITAIVDAVPGASDPLALFVPLEALLTSQLQRGTSIVAPNSVWVAGDPAADDALSAALGDRPVTTATPGLSASVVGALVPGWWIATAGSAVLSLVAAFAIVQTLALARRRELGVLRALGVTASRQSRMRAAELGGVFAAAVVLGAAAGALVSWLIVPGLVRAVTAGILPLAGGVSFAWPPLALALGGLVVALGVIVAAAAIGAGRVARSATVGEEAR